MAMGIFQQLDWLTQKVKRLCCAVDYNQSTEYIFTNNPIAPPPSGNSRFVVYDTTTAVPWPEVDMTAVPGKEGQTITICLELNPLDPGGLYIKYGLPGITNPWVIGNDGKSCFTVFYINGYWIGQVISS